MAGRFGKIPDIEAGGGDVLYPGMSMEDSAMRWAFVRKVYGIIGIQLVFTAVVAACFVLVPEVKGFVYSPDNSWFVIVAFVLPFVTMIPLFCYRYSHPLNLVLLSVWTASLSLVVGVACSLYQGPIVLEALALTAAVVVGLTAYTFWASRQGYDFGFLGPLLFASLLVLIVWGFIQIFFKPGPFGQFIFALIGALIFSAYIIYDTDNIIKRHSFDEYVWASVSLYLDIINLFLRLLEILGYLQRNN